jgi:tetratricopeptide (TPR) repeat protein
MAMLKSYSDSGLPVCKSFRGCDGEDHVAHGVVAVDSDRLGLMDSTGLFASAEGLRGSRVLGSWTRRMCSFAWVAVLLCATSASAAAARGHTNPLNFDPLVQDAFHYFYLLDYPAAVERFERFHAEHPGDPHATALLLEAELFQELYRQDLLDTTFYANDGFLTGRHATQEDPKIRDRILSLADEAVGEADWRLSKDPKDVDALYARGWARALKCTYIAMVQRGFGSGFRLATKAKDDSEQVLELDPDYIDAKLVVGVYQYVVGALPLPFKFLIGFAGITGSKSKGLETLHDVAERGVMNKVEARTVTALFLRREGRYKEAIEIVQGLKQQYPRDYLFCLEEANLRKDAGEGMVAVQAYREIVASNAKPGYFAEARMELTYFGLGDALRGQRHYAEAAQAYEDAALTKTSSPELKVRSFLGAGQCRDMNGERQQAVKNYQAAIDAGPATSRADSARKYLRSPYKGN